MNSRRSVMGRGVPDYWRAAVCSVRYILRNCGGGISSRRNKLLYLLTEELSFDTQEKQNIYACHCLKNCLSPDVYY
jgi:hypothetical protein